MSSTSLSWVKVGDMVEVACDQGYFYEAEAMDVRTERGRREIFVHYPRGVLQKSFAAFFAVARLSRKRVQFDRVNELVALGAA